MMFRAISSILGLFVCLQAAESARAGHMPPNEAGIKRALAERGLIPPNATEQRAQAVYRQYIQQRLSHTKEFRNPLAASSLNRAERIGKPVNNHGRVLLPNNVRFDNVLTLLVEFDGTNGSHNGPLHNRIPAPRPGNTGTLWIPDFNQAHYQRMLFDRMPGARSMANYFLEQSGNAYTLSGQVYGWVSVPNSEWFYGANKPDGSGDDLNGPVWRIVQDAVNGACSVPWKQFDTEDPYDLDGDGITAEPDGYVDHLQIAHAGVGEEAGGGTQGEDAIWSHSWFANLGGADGPGLGGVPTCDPQVWVGPYTIQPEDGTIGVFAHEFGHDLGLPDLYDTIYSGDPSTAYWTIMSSGSWLGCPGQADGTCPASMSGWEKWMLGFVDPVVVRPGEVAREVLLRQSTAAGPANKAVQVLLPNYTYSVTINTPASPPYEWYSGMGDNLNNTLTRQFDLPSGAVLTFQTWYGIEKDWDYGYVELSADGGGTWQTMPGNITTSADPNGNNGEGNGITGTSGGWIPATFDLSAWSGQTVLLRFRYETDPLVQGSGWAIDDIALGGFSDNVAGNSGWTARGWSVFNGARTTTTFHYYVAEWRTPAGFDIGLNNWPSFGPPLKASPGMLLWYRNGRYDDNWVGVHPWAGQLLVVDAHPSLVAANGLADFANLLFDPDPDLEPPFPTWIQMVDAAFGQTPVPEQPLTHWWGVGTTSVMPELPGVPTFDDSLSYVDTTWAPWLDAGPYSWVILNAVSSVATPSYGLKIDVLSSTPAAGRIAVDFTGYAP